MITPRFILFAFACLAMGCQPDRMHFAQRLPEETGVHFINRITENDSLNILKVEFVYNGGGVAIGDLNGDGWDDLFFTGNQVDNAAYLNRGQFRFEDITGRAGLQKTHPRQWSSGVNVLDINRDGRLDVYVCNTLQAEESLRRNLLYVNQGNDADGVPLFEEMAAAYGLDDPSHSSHAQFFDYDNDGDLDLFVGVNWIEREYPSQFVELTHDGSAPNRDRLFRNDWIDSLGHPVFTDVSLQAGLVHDGYSHSTLIYDFNNDGWQDIYVANDYWSNDLIFINQQNGTFTNQAGKIFKHFSLSAMGSDLADLNGDGQAEIFTSEMQPYYNKRKKLFQSESSYQTQIYTEEYNYEYQYTRNTLQLNQGTNPATGLPLFSDIGLFARVQETDWSWASLFADYDNDGWTDLYIANGFPKDVIDHDFSDFRIYARNLVSQEKLLAAIPQVKSPNFLFRHRGDLTFENVTKDWGLDLPSFSNGAAYGDLDQDGDLDLVVNNIDDPAFLFENKQHQPGKLNPNGHFLRIQLQGPVSNPDAFGASVDIYHAGRRQKKYLLSARGYLSTPEHALHFGLGQSDGVDSILVHWPDGMSSRLGPTAANQTLEITYGDGPMQTPGHSPAPGPSPLFESAAASFQLHYQDTDIDFVDFNFQRTLPHKFSQYGPSLAVGDVNGDGLEDLFLSGSWGAPETWMIQQADGHFLTRKVYYKRHVEFQEEDAGSLLFDADSDGDLDLYLVRGSAQHPAGDTLYQDALYLNDGKGGFTWAPGALPELRANGSCVKAADFDGDGDLDLFVGSRVLPQAYPLPDRSYLLRNESRGGEVRFVDATEAVCADLLKPGLISDALWTDHNGDHRPDLLLAGEWMPLRLFENRGDRLVEITEGSGLADRRGWWNSLAAADIDLDGDIDYVAGNFGENTYFQCSTEEPIRVYGKDLDNNGMVDPLISCYWPDSLGVRREYFYHPLQDFVKQLVSIRKQFQSYGAYGEATVEEVFDEGELDDAPVFSANFMQTVALENLGGGQFRVRPLPTAAQLAPVYGILPYDVDADGRLDILLTGNDFGMELQQGRADALPGLVLMNRGDWRLEPVPLAESHFLVSGDARGLATIATAGGQELILAAQNRDSLRVFQPAIAPQRRLVPLEAGEVKALVHFADGRRRLEEYYLGSGFMAQRGRYLALTPGVVRIDLFDGRGALRRSVGESL